MAWVQRQLWRIVYGGSLMCAVWAGVGLVRLLAAPGPLWLQVDRTRMFAPTKLTVDVHVVPVDDDRTIWLAAVSDDEASSSEIPLFDGAQSRRTYHWVWSVRTPGEYTVTAQVGHAARVRAEARLHITIP